MKDRVILHLKNLIDYIEKGDLTDVNVEPIVKEDFIEQCNWIKRKTNYKYTLTIRGESLEKIRSLWTLVKSREDIRI